MQVAEKYNARVTTVDSLLCVGLDADITRLPARFHREAYPQFAFNRWIIEQTHSFVSAYKPNIAFYEARGVDGWAELQMTMDYLREHHPEIVTICDAKRADIGNTNRGYATAIFDTLGFDAITLHPYLGGAALMPFLERSDKASIILCHTSNEGAGEFQHLEIDGKALWRHVLEQVRDAWNTNNNCMLVIGATYPAILAEARAEAPALTFLVPGLGAQGGDASAIIHAGVNEDGLGLIVNSSRGVIFAEDPATAASELAAQLRVRPRG
jgi:orotidine-5'-phosphate decarboxylase